MDDLVQSIGWLAPVLFGLLSWLALQFRESRWGQELARRFGFARREHEQEWEFQRRIGSFWLTIAVIVGVLTYSLGQRLFESEFDAPSWQLIAALAGAILCIWSVFSSIRAFRASRRES